MRWAGALLLFASLSYGQGNTITGTVGAPGGSLAMRAPFFGGVAHAHLPDLKPVAGATVQLIEVDAKGAQVSGILANAVTNSGGAYTLNTPAGFAPSARFVVRALDGAANRLDAFAMGPRVNIDPATDATRALVAAAVANAGRRMADVRLRDAMAVLPLVQHLAWEVDPQAKLTSSGLSAALRDAAAADEEVSSIVASIVGRGEVNGTVTDPAKKPIAAVAIAVRKPRDPVTRAIAHTDARGRYSVRVAPGDYVLEALNQSPFSAAASQTGRGTVSVGKAPVTHDFQLGAGGRISGRVTAEAGRALIVNARVHIRGAQSTFEVRTQDDGGYRLNVAPGAYAITVHNTTLQPYASSLLARRVTVEAGAAVTADVGLVAGELISGVVSDAAVRIDDVQVRTNAKGQYRLWVAPGTHTVR